MSENTTSGQKLDATDCQGYGAIPCAICVPHPPVIIPSVGKGEESTISETISSYKEAASSLASQDLDLIVLASPHAPLFGDGFFISDADKLHGDMSRFNARSTELEVPGDPDFAEDLAQEIEDRRIAVARESALGNRFIPGANSNDVDHGTFVPLYFLNESGMKAPVVRIGLSGLGADAHESVGEAIFKVAESCGKKVGIVASGDLSHKLKEDGPYGFDPAGPVFDERIGEIFEKGDLEELFSLDEKMCEDAAECGLRSFQIMAGALKAQEESRSGLKLSSRLLSNEGPFGVGYAVAILEA